MTFAGARPAGDSALETASDLIIAGIREGRYAPGQRLVEADLVEELNVSRSSVREALRRLEPLGVVEMVPHRGARVKRLSADDVREIYEARAALESEAARLAAQRIDHPGNRRKLKASLKALQDATRDGDVIRYLDENTRWHETIFEIAANKQLAILIGMMRLQTIRYTLPSYVADATRMGDLMKRSLSQHQRVTERILSGSPEGAADAMRNHIEVTGEVISNAVTDSTPQRLRRVSTRTGS